VGRASSKSSAGGGGTKVKKKTAGLKRRDQSLDRSLGGRDTEGDRLPTLKHQKDANTDRIGKKRGKKSGERSGLRGQGRGAQESQEKGTQKEGKIRGGFTY